MIAYSVLILWSGEDYACIVETGKKLSEEMINRRYEESCALE